MRIIGALTRSSYEGGLTFVGKLARETTKVKSLFKIIKEALEAYATSASSCFCTCIFAPFFLRSSSSSQCLSRCLT